MNLLHVFNHQFSQVSKIISIITDFTMTQNSCFECKPSFQAPLQEISFGSECFNFGFGDQC